MWSQMQSLTDYDIVILPGGYAELKDHGDTTLFAYAMFASHDKGVKQFIESASLHKLLVEYVPLTKGPGSNKVLGSIW